MPPLQPCSRLGLLTLLGLLGLAAGQLLVTIEIIRNLAPAAPDPAAESGRREWNPLLE
jgi:hypothetical protein